MVPSCQVIGTWRKISGGLRIRSRVENKTIYVMRVYLGVESKGCWLCPCQQIQKVVLGFNLAKSLLPTPRRARTNKHNLLLYTTVKALFIAPAYITDARLLLMSCMPPLRYGRSCALVMRACKSCADCFINCAMMRYCAQTLRAIGIIW